jgi:pyrroloquinoline quinone biosynthesis protein D
MIQATIVLNIAEDVTFQSLSDGRQTIILRISTGQIFTCNGTTAAFLKAMDGRRTFKDLVDCVHAEFDVDREKLAGDLGALTEKLVAGGLVVSTTGGSDGL